MKYLRVAYFGTPDFSADFLEKILLDKNLPVEVKLILTQPDRPVGRKKTLTPSPVKQIAQKYKIQTVNPMRVDLAKKLSEDNVDLALLYAYGEILPPDFLEAPRYGFWNIHPSLLPKYRGASPITMPLVLGDEKTGVTLFQMDHKLDHGPIIAQEEYKILPSDNRADLEKNLTNLAYNLFKKALIVISNEVRDLNEISPRQLAGRNDKMLKLQTQNDTEATFTRKLTKQDGFINLEVLKKAMNNIPLTGDELPGLLKEYLSQTPVKACIPAAKLAEYRTDSAETIYNFFRGVNPWPGVWTYISNKRLKITNVEFKKNLLNIKTVQLEGKKESMFEEFNKAYQIF